MGQHLPPSALIFITLLFIQPYSVVSSNKYAKITPEKVINSFFWPENGETSSAQSFKNSADRFSKCPLAGSLSILGLGRLGMVAYLQVSNYYSMKLLSRK